MVRRLGVLAIGFAMAAAACGGADKAEPTAPLIPTLPPQTATSTPRPTSGPASPTPAPTATATPQAAGRDAVIAAALAATNGRLVSPLSRDRCLESNPENKVCIDLVTADGALDRGVARFNGGDPQGGGFAFLMAKDASGAWAFWQGTQQTFAALVALPGDLRICGGGNDVSVLQEPDAAAKQAGTLKDKAVAKAEQFRLTTPGAFRGARGQGFYRVAGDVSGWVSSRDIADAALGDCVLHDALEGTRSTG